MIFTMEFFNFNEHDDPAIESSEKNAISWIVIYNF